MYTDFQRFSCFFCTLALLYTFTNKGDTGEEVRRLYNKGQHNDVLAFLKMLFCG